MTSQKCKKCNRTYKSLADGLCFFCDKEHWRNYFNKFKGKDREK
jgi:hypothetical protein